jgi:FMN hydrolase / 5-amino-6-(5-phospho-D-ribitylamino)uracil phosphatase
VRAIAFDLDNTLWDVGPVLARAEAHLSAWLQEHCPRIAQTLSPQDMRRARELLAQREPHNAHDVTYLRIAALAAHARELGYEECIAQQAFEVFLSAGNQVQLHADVAPALARLARRYRLASLSNGNADLRCIGLDQVFTVSLNARQRRQAAPALLRAPGGGAWAQRAPDPVRGGRRAARRDGGARRWLWHRVDEPARSRVAGHTRARGPGGE